MSSSRARRPLLLGECPSKAGDRYYGFPLSGRPAERLLAFAGIPREREDGDLVAAYWTLTEHFDVMNASERHVPRWDADARASAGRRWNRYLLHEVPGRDRVTVVCLGKRAAETIGMVASGFTWGEWREAGLLQYVAIPHPSGRNLLYNDAEMRALAGLVLREALTLVRCGPGSMNRNAYIEDGRVKPADFVRGAAA